MWGRGGLSVYTLEDSTPGGAPSVDFCFCFFLEKGVVGHISLVTSGIVIWK